MSMYGIEISFIWMYAGLGVTQKTHWYDLELLILFSEDFL